MKSNEMVVGKNNTAQLKHHNGALRTAALEIPSMLSSSPWLLHVINENATSLMSAASHTGRDVAFTRLCPCCWRWALNNNVATSVLTTLFASKHPFRIIVARVSSEECCWRHPPGTILPAPCITSAECLADIISVGSHIVHWLMNWWQLALRHDVGMLSSTSFKCRKS